MVVDKSGSSLSAAAVLCLCLLLAIVFHFSYLGWGLPNPQRSFRVLGDPGEIQKWAPQMMEQRKKYYQMIENLVDKDQPFQRSYEQIAQRWDTPPFEIMPQEIVLDRMRQYLIGVNVSDDQVVMSAISGLNPKKLDFVPGTQRHYGGIYYYTAGAFLMFGKLAGWVTLNPGVEYYFDHPEEIQWMYRLVRAIGGVSILITILALYLTMKRLYSFSIANWTLLFFTLAPLPVPYTHLTKAHLYGMVWLAAAVYFCGLILKNSPAEPDRQNSNPTLFRCYCLAGVSLGLCVGTLITNLYACSLLFFTEWARQEYRFMKTFKSKNFWISVFLVSLVFSLTNFYTFIYFDEFRRFVKAMVAFYPAYASIEWFRWIPYLKEFCAQQFHWSVIPLFLIGAILSVKRKEKFILVCLLSFLVMFLQNLVIMNHAPVNIRFLPLMAIVCGWGAVQFLNSVEGWKKKLFLGYLIFSVTISGIQCYYYSSLHKEPSNLDQAGEWINQNVPPGSTVGAWGGGFTPFDYPAIRFLDYKMVHIPHHYDLHRYDLEAVQLPQYLILPMEDSFSYVDALESNPVLKKRYRMLKSWEQPRFWNLKFDSDLVKTGNWRVLVYEKV